MAFRLLGEVGAEIGGRPVEFGHARQRCVLAVLLVAANQPVSVERLASRVWGESQPQRVHGTVYSYLSRLRQALAPADGVGIVRRSGGYLLTVDPLVVDLHRFRELATRARAAGAAAEAEALFAQALGLWRGEAFAGLDTAWLNGLRHTLDRERLAAELDRHDLVLARGRPAELLPGLVARSAAYPLDERLAGQLMAALYRCGRQAEALERYEQLRRRLAGELGTDPGPALRRLHRQILIADPALAVPPRAAGSPRPDVPHQLPPPPPLFVGRTRHLAELSTAMAVRPDRAAAVTIGVIAGPGGIGKSWLALRWAHDHRSRFPDGQLYVNLRGFEPAGEPVSPAVAVAGFLAALGVPAAAIPPDLDAQAALFRSLTAGTRLLVVLDNARDTGQALPLLPGGPDNAVLVTSRHSLAALVTAHGARSLALDLLTETEATELLTRRLGAERVAAEPGQVAAVRDHCAGLPLALGVVAARATIRPGLSLAAVASELQDSATRLDALDAGELSANLRAVLACSYRALGADAALVFGLIGLAPGAEIGLAALVSLTALPVARVRAALRELLDAHLLQEPVSGRYRMHDLVRLYAGERARERTDQEPAVRRLLDHYLHSADLASRAIRPDRDRLALPPAQPNVRPEAFTSHAAALGWFGLEHQVLVAAVEQAAAGGFDGHAWQLAAALQPYLSRHGHWHQLVTTQRTAVRAARRLADPAAQAHAHRGLGVALIWLGRYQDAGAELRRARELFDQLGDPLGQAHARRSLARWCAQQGRHRDALPHDQQALALYRAAGNQAGEATVLNAVGWHHAKLGDHRLALGYCRRSVALFRRIGERYGQAFAWHSLGYACHQLGRHRHAVGCYQRALDLFREYEDRYNEGVACAGLGDTHQAAGSRDAARTAWQQALSILDQLGHPAADQVRVKLGAVAG